MTTHRFAPLLRDRRFAVAAATLPTLPNWTSGLAKVADPMTRFHERNTFLEHAGLIGGLMPAAIVREKTR